MADEILGFLFELDFAVAQYPEYALGHDRKTGKQVIEEQGNHLLNRQKPNWLTGQPNETMDRSRDQGKRLQSLAVTDPFQLQHQAEAAIGDERERMRGIDGQRRQHRKDLDHKVLLKPSPVARRKTVGIGDRYSGIIEQLAQR